jgi:hypothetical protein
MKLQTWRTVGKNPSVFPPATITIAPVEETTFVFPWVLPLERAIEIFGQGTVDQIGEKPLLVHLHLMIPATELSGAEFKEPEGTI